MPACWVWVWPVWASPVAGAGDGDADELNQAIAKVKEQLGQQPDKPTTPPAASTLSGRVELGELARGQFAAGDTVFVYAIATQGPRAPLAIVRTTVLDRFVRHGERAVCDVSITVGGTLVAISLLGLLHIARGAPTFADGRDALADAAGYIGALIGVPIEFARSMDSTRSALTVAASIRVPFKMPLMKFMMPRACLRSCAMTITVPTSPGPR